MLRSCVGIIALLGVVSGLLAHASSTAGIPAPPAVPGRLGGQPPSDPAAAAPALIATAIGTTVAIYDTPDEEPGVAQPSAVLPSPWSVNQGSEDQAAVPLVFLIAAQGNDGWLQVWLPIRPNGATGWIRGSDVTLTTTGYRIVVTLREHRLTVYDADQMFLVETIAVGAPATPTPTGRYFLTSLLRAPQPGTVYGPYAYGLSGHSPTLTVFAGVDAVLGIHGNDDASVLGSDVTHGCIRMSNEGITELAGILPLGTPVDIVA